MAELSPRPSDQHVLGIFFPEFETKPQLIWIKISSNIEAEGLPIDAGFHPRGIDIATPNRNSYLGTNSSLWGLDNNEFYRQNGGSVLPDSDRLQFNPRNGAGSSYRWLDITGRNDARDSQVPRSLLAVATPPTQSYWYGPLVFQAVKEGQGLGECGVYADVTLADLRLVVDSVLSWPRDEFLPPGPTRMEDSGDEDDDEPGDQSV
ncbi:Fc.00g086940.m01.CDS01 [Cosmosporella sp. VM-42]